MALPIAAMFDRYDIAGMLMLAVLVEVGVLLLNHMRCPLTDVAARFTTDRRANFDICLPLWLARHNKTVFGCLFVIGVVFVLIRWLRYVDA